jgi:hypothetical protein
VPYRRGRPIPSLVERLENRAGAYPADLLDLGSPDRLAIGDDRERLERRGGQALRPRCELGALDRLGVFGSSENLPSSGNFDQLDSVTLVVVVIAQLGERRFERRLTIIGVRSHDAQRVDRNRNRAREERGLKQLR